MAEALKPTTWKHGNYSFRDPPFKDGDVVEGGNYCQLEPGTAICAAVETLTIIGGNFVNCIPQAGWTVTGGNWCQIGYCTHDRPELIDKGLKPCADDCEHRSAAKVERAVDEREYRDKLAEAKDIAKPIQLADLAVEKSVDADGVTLQAFKVSEYEYKSTVTQTGKPVLGEAEAK